jgi:hypothetical protein
VAERDLPYEVPEPDYVKLDMSRLARLRSNPNDLWGNQTPIAICVRCERRYTEDPNRDHWGLSVHEDWEDDLENVCDHCRDAALDEALEEHMLLVLEEKLGLAEVHRDALKSFIETIFTDPKKILQVQDLDNRVRELEKQNGRFWTFLQLAYGLLAVLITSVLAIAIALAF